jgi:hypothetical protein
LTGWANKFLGHQSLGDKRPVIPAMSDVGSAGLSVAWVVSVSLY